MTITIKNYVFNPIAFNQQEITFSDYSSIEIERVIRVYNLTYNASLYEADPLLSSKGTVSGNILQLNVAANPMFATDKLHIQYDDPSYDVPGTILDNRKVVSTASTRVQLSSTSIPCKTVVVTAELSNTGVITVGSSTVIASASTRRGTPLSAGDSCVLEIDNLNKLYLDSTVSGEGVTYTMVV